MIEEIKKRLAEEDFPPELGSAMEVLLKKGWVIRPALKIIVGGQDFIAQFNEDDGYVICLDQNDVFQGKYANLRYHPEVAKVFEATWEVSISHEYESEPEIRRGLTLLALLDQLDNSRIEKARGGKIPFAGIEKLQGSEEFIQRVGERVVYARKNFGQGEELAFYLGLRATQAQVKHALGYLVPYETREEAIKVSEGELITIAERDIERCLNEVAKRHVANPGGAVYERFFEEFGGGSHEYQKIFVTAVENGQRGDLVRACLPLFVNEQGEVNWENVSDMGTFTLNFFLNQFFKEAREWQVAPPK